MMFGHDGGSIPEFIMRTGAYAMFNPLHARQDINAKHVEREVSIPVGQRPGTAQYTPPPTPAPVAGYLGQDQDGRPIAKYEMPGAPTPPEARQAAAALATVARQIQSRGLPALVPSLIGGPLASLLRGEKVVLRWTNGVAISAIA
jgi:hypothetical protein